MTAASSPMPNWVEGFTLENLSLILSIRPNSPISLISVLFSEFEAISVIFSPYILKTSTKQDTCNVYESKQQHPTKDLWLFELVSKLSLLILELTFFHEKFVSILYSLITFVHLLCAQVSVPNPRRESKKQALQ